MLHMIAGDEEAWRSRPFVSQSNCFVVPPMKFAEESLECLRIAVEGGMPVSYFLWTGWRNCATMPRRHRVPGLG